MWGGERAPVHRAGSYTPAEQYSVLSTKPRATRLTHFATDERGRYLGRQLEGGLPLKTYGPGPAYAPRCEVVLRNPGSTRFGKPRRRRSECVLRRSPLRSDCGPRLLTRFSHPPPPPLVGGGSVHARSAWRRPGANREEHPGPAAYSPAPQDAPLSTKARVPAFSIGKGDRFHTASLGNLLPCKDTPAPSAYTPDDTIVRPATRGAKIGTAKRFPAEFF